MRKIAAVPLVLVSALIGGAVTNLYTQNTDTEYNKFKQAISMLESGYFKSVERSKLVDGAINGMVEALDDPYSDYLNQEETEQFNEHISSSFVGIGAEVKSEDDKIIIVSPIKGSPAEKAGLKPGDRIMKVDETVLDGMKVAEAVKLIRGEKGTKVRLTIVRPGHEGELVVTIVRDTIPLETVFYEMTEDKIGIVTVTTFAQPTAEEFEKAVRELKSKGMEGLVLDLRQNPGGLLNVAIDMANMFLETGKTVLQSERRGGEREVYKAEHRDVGLDGLPVAVLVDGGSASASEIMAAALRDSGGAAVVGVKTFGKGTAQAVSEFPDGSNMNFTVAKWLTPKGDWIHEKGVVPDIAVELPAYANIPLINPEQELKQDAFSAEIKSLQEMLSALGYEPGRKDGFFDQSTKEAVIKFQKAKGLEPTGTVIGETTIQLIEQLREKILANDTQKQAAVKWVKERM
ncbi:S41 family peptidase [Paenibacillus alkalitolerans]|uniref:S41 family peptidase n=1 Tax=Paenibacillus alkalitolerans TaxID=2799335 RepID=UPI0018F770C4|nr:S41 family peptidase [Paenibacillus alkalitolerans]